MVTDIFSHKWKIESNLYSLDFGIKNIHQNDNPRILTVNYLKKKRFIYLFSFWLWWVFVVVFGLFSSCGKRGLLFVEVHRLLTVVVFLVSKYRR